MQRVSTLALLLFLVPLTGFAKDTAQKDMIQADPTGFAAQRAEIEKSMASDKYTELTRTQREEVDAALDRMEEILVSIESVDDLEHDQKEQLFNDQELVNNVLTQAREDSRMVCKKQQRTGSHRLNNYCRTVGEIRRERENSQDSLRRMQRITLPNKE
jgi:hypothetical protein